MSQEDLKHALDSFLDTDLDLSLKDCWSHDLEFGAACQGESLLLEEKNSGDPDMDDFSWGPSEFPPPFMEASAYHEPVPLDGASRTSDQPSLDTASSSGELLSGKKYVMPASDFALRRSSEIPSFGLGEFCCHDTITTCLPGALQDWYKSGFTDSFMPMGMCPAMQNVPMDFRKSQGSEHGSSEKQVEMPKRQRVEDPDLSQIKDPEERKRQKRMAKNRHTAAVSRERRRKYLSDLENRVKTLEHENMSLRYWLGAAQHENLALKAGQQWNSTPQHQNPSPAEVACIHGHDNQEPAVLYKITLLAILQMVVSPAILPLVGLLVVLMGSLQNGSEEDLNVLSTSTFVCVSILILGILCASTLQEKHKDRKRKWGEIGENIALDDCTSARSQGEARDLGFISIKQEVIKTESLHTSMGL